MIKEVGTFEAKTHLSRLLDEVAGGDTIYITKHGKRVAELRPPEQMKRTKAKFGCAKGPGFYMAPDFDAPLEEFEDYAPDWRAVTAVQHLEPIHGDPFDRIQVAQARHRGLDIISRDPVFDRYGLRRVW